MKSSGKSGRTSMLRKKRRTWSKRTRKKRTPSREVMKRRPKKKTSLKISASASIRLILN